MLQQAKLTVLMIIRDRVVYAIAGVALAMLVLVPVVSLFSMRQAQELAITLSLSCISLVLLILTVLLGASSVWRDVERRYVASLLGLPVSRAGYLLGKFMGIAIFLMGCTLVLGLVALVVIKLSAAQYPSDVPVQWSTVMLAVTLDGLKYVLLAAVALLFSSLSTSFFLPIFGTLAIYFAGNASQEVMEYVSGEISRQMSPAAQLIIRGVHYLLPNLAAFDLKVEAIYALQVDVAGLTVSLLYFFFYTGALLWLAVRAFTRRELS